MDISEQITENQPDTSDVTIKANVENIEDDSTSQNLSDELLLTNNKNTYHVQQMLENTITDNTSVTSIENNVHNKVDCSANINVTNNESVDKGMESESQTSNLHEVYKQTVSTEENSSNQGNNSNLLSLQENSQIHTDNNEDIAENMKSSVEKQIISDLTLSEKTPVLEINNEEKTLKEMEVKSMDCELNSETNTDHQISKEFAVKDTAVSSLATIAAAYNSSDSDVAESDIDDDVQLCKNSQSSGDKSAEICVEKSKNIYRVNEEVIISSEESDSDTDSSSSSSSDLSSAKSDSDESNDHIQNRSVNRNTRTSRSTKETKSELDSLPPIEELTISVPEVLCDPFGEVAWTVEQLVVVRPKPGKPTLNLDTVLFVERGQRALGKIFDVFGQVSEPYYCVRFNSSEHIKESNIKVGMLVYYCPNTEYTSLVFLHELTKMKGADEGGGDDEPPDFSDDEEERKYYEALKKKGTKPRNNGNEAVPHKRSRATSPTGWQSNHPWNRTTRVHSSRQAGYNANMNPWQRNAMQNSYNSQQWQARPTGFQHQNSFWCQPMLRNIPPNLNNQYENPYFPSPVPPMQPSAYNANAYHRFNHPFQGTQLQNQEHLYPNTPMDPRSQVASGPGPMWYPLPPPPPPPPPL